MVNEKDLVTVKLLNDVIAKHNLWVHNLRFLYTLEPEVVLYFKDLIISKDTSFLIVTDNKQSEAFSTIIQLRSIMLQKQCGGLSKLYVSYKSKQLIIWGYEVYFDDSDDFVDFYIDQIR